MNVRDFFAIKLIAALLLPSEAPGGAPLTLLVLTPTSPAFFRIGIETSGTDLEAAWEENARRLFDRLDEYDDGFLGESERIPGLLGPEESASPASGSFGTVFPEAMIGDADWLDFRDRLRASAPPFQLRLTPRQATGEDDPLFDRLDRDGDGAIRPEEIPVTYRAVLAPGAPELPGFPVQVRARLAVDADPVGVPHEAGPLWFRKMDRNRDGDLSPGEFLGTSDDFSNLDLDDDGLVDALEARQAAPADGG